jgi:hypothetical protein
MIPGLVLNENLGEFLINCRWQVLDVSRASVSMLLSDMPILFTPLKTKGGHLGLVVGPTKIFVASADHGFLDELKKTPPTSIAKQANRLCVGRARHFVVGRDRRQQGFVEKHMGTLEIGSLAFSFAR